MKNKINSCYLFLLVAGIMCFQVTRGLAQVKSFSGSATYNVADSLTKKIDGIFAQFDKSTSPGCALAILKDGEIIYKKSYGMANLEYDIPISPSSKFHVASISKQFTAAAILRLAAEGKISLAADIRKYLPEVPDFGYAITFNHLLHHTSGLRDQWDLQKLAGWRSDDVITENDITDMLKRQRSLNFVPGDEFSYSNTGYTLLGMAVKRITGVPLHDYVDSVFFVPLGMRNTYFHHDHAEVIPNRTSAYLEQKSKWRIFLPVFDNYGATGLFTTVEDLAEWDKNFYTKKVGDSNFIKAMEQIGSLNDNTPLIYASGLVIEDYKGHKTIGHPGADAGYRANYLRFPEQHFSVIILGNAASMNTTALSKKVADLFIEDNSIGKHPVNVRADTTKLKKCAGTYWDSVSKFLVIITYKDRKVWKGSVALEASNNNTFIDKSAGAIYKFKDVDTNKIFELDTPGYKTMTYKKVNKETVPVKELSAYTGEFYSTELNTRYDLLVTDGALFLKAPRNQAIRLNSLTKNTFTGPIILEFSRDAKNNVTGYHLTMGRTRNIYFRKMPNLNLVF